MNKASQVYKKIKHIPTSQAIDALAREWYYRKPPPGIRKERAVVAFTKIGGVLDPVMTEMCPDIWTEEMKLRPNVRKAIFDNLNEYIPKDAIKQVVVLGAITGLQYGSDKEDRETADVDVNVVLDPPELVQELWEVRREHNDRIIPGTRHPINVYLQEHTGVIPGYQDSYFGVYDVLTDTWLVQPPPKEAYRNPNDVYWSELVSIKMLANEFIRRVDNYEFSLADSKKAVLDARKIIGIKQRIERDLKQIVEFIENLQEGRDLVYNVGWGTPRSEYQNILYKFVHDTLPTKYKAALKEVEDLIHKSKFEDVSNSRSQG